jgi:hypothetical protein
MESRSHPLIAGLFVILLGLGAIAAAVSLEPEKGQARVPIDLLKAYFGIDCRGRPPRTNGAAVEASRSLLCLL